MPNSNQQPGEACELKAGHPPAVKVGNMRVSQRTHSTSSNHSDKNDGEKGGSGDCCVPSACSFAPKTVVKQATSGAPENAVQSVPEAVKQFHDKPVASHEYRAPNLKQNVIQQPRK